MKSENISQPNLSLPKGGGAVSGIGETFQPNAFTGTASLSIPIPTSPSRGFEPHLSIDYSSGSGNGIFGIGFNLAIPNISRKTAKAIPRYDDTDTFLISDADDLVLKLKHTSIEDNGKSEWEEEPAENRTEDKIDYTIFQFRPRTEGLFARIEKWVPKKGGATHWRVTSKDNVTSIYGKDPKCRIADPDDKTNTHIAQWLLERSYDAHGNQIVYTYQEDGANKHISSIKYGNYSPDTMPQSEDDWHFEVRFTYSNPATLGSLREEIKTDPDRTHPRPDPFSSYKSGFHIRTTVRCTDISMYHRFDGENGGDPFKVSSTEFDYLTNEDRSALTFLNAVKQLGHRGDAAKAMPTLQFSWSKSRMGEDTNADTPDPIGFKSLKSGGGTSIPGFLQKGAQQMVDLYGEGLPGILYTDADTVLYSRPLGAGCYAASDAPHAFPIERNLQEGELALMDLGGDGKLALVVTSVSRMGYYELSRGGNWEPYRSFASTPTELHHPQRQMVDVTGDGLADLLFFEEGAVKVYPSKGKLGYDTQYQQSTDSRLPVTSHPSKHEAIHFADPFGDGGSHLMRIRSGSVECWPNLGYGRFGPMVAIANAPWFGAEMDASRLFLTDIDGSGMTDLVYVASDGVDIYRNESGNRFSAPVSISLPQPWHDLSQISFADVLGNGTACLVVSSVNHDMTINHQYYDFTAGVKPHLLTAVDNNRGATTLIHYSPSTKFYLADEKAGTPWITRLPFPVQVVEKIETTDHISGSRLVASYSYHHGFFDPVEREFRGFGRVERQDAETFDLATPLEPGKAAAALPKDRSHDVPPILTKTWYHTGAYAEAHIISQQYAGEYYKGDKLASYDKDDKLVSALPDSTLDAQFKEYPERKIEAYRALHGHVLHEEVYGLDHKHNPSLENPKLDEHPYTVTESNFYVKLLQAKADQNAAVCLVHPCETISYHYERNPADPRVEHTFTTQVDGFGHVLESCHVFYSRRKGESAHPEQQQPQLKALVTVDSFINAEAGDCPKNDLHLLGVPREERTFELGGLIQAGDALLTLSDIAEYLEKALKEELRFEQKVKGDAPQVRLLSRKKHLYWDQGLIRALDFGAVAAHGLHHHSEEAVFSEDAASEVFADKITKEVLTEAKYVLKEDGYWWNPGLVQHYQNQGGFYLPSVTVDPFGAATTVSYDKFNLVPESITDAVGNKTHAVIDRHTLQPWHIKDINDNISEVLFDPLAMVIATSVYNEKSDDLQKISGIGLEMEKKLHSISVTRFEQILALTDTDIAIFDEQLSFHGRIKRDHWQEQAADLAENSSHEGDAPIADYLLKEQKTTAREVLARPKDFLQQATSYFFYELEFVANQPPHSVTLQRETHVQNSITEDEVKIQVHVAYSDGFGRALQSKLKAGPGQALGLNKDAKLVEVQADVRWLSSGRTVYNNKGKPVKQYEPFYTAAPDYIPEPKLNQQGVTHTTHYDPLGRVVRVTNPDGYFSKVEFTPWEVKHYDENDTAKESPFFNTPQTQILDSQGRPFLTIQKNEGTVAETAFADLFDNDTAKSKALWNQLKTSVFLDFRAALTAAFKPDQANFSLRLNNQYKVKEDLIIKRLSQIQAEGELLITQHELDVEGHELSSTDPRLGRLNDKNKTSHRNFEHKYDMHGGVLWMWSADAGERWSLRNAMGSTLRIWDSRHFQISTSYDALHRPVEISVEGDDGEGLVLNNVVEKMIYGEGQADDKKHNLRGKLVRHYDQAGLVEVDAYDFKGEPLMSTRRLRVNYKLEANWCEGKEEDLLEDENFQSKWKHDALGRIIREVHPDGSISLPKYHPEGWLRQLDVTLAGSTEKLAESFVRNISYNEKGLRTQIEYGSGVTKSNDKGVTTTYEYHEKTYRLTQLKTVDGKRILQDIGYTYDPVGNITGILDASHKAVFTDRQIVEPLCEYTYDALYQLTTASGREHPALNQSTSKDGVNQNRSLNLNNSQQLRNYTEHYSYDIGGNLTHIKHQTDQAWTRDMTVSDTTNRAVSTTLAHTSATVDTAFDAHGNLKKLDNLRKLCWNYRDNIASATLIERDDDAADIEYYVYDGAGQRMRKVTETLKGSDSGRRIEIAETLYLGGVEIKRVKQKEGDVLKTNSERWSLHVSDGQERIAIAHHWTLGDKKGTKQIRYQLGNHLGSASLELTDNAEIISYEEYLPYGGTAFIAGKDKTEVKRKTYRYSGKERDDSTGLYYYGARYYAPWLGRWLNPDPAGTVDGLNLYAFVSGNPIVLVDEFGFSGTSPRTNISNQTTRAQFQHKGRYEGRRGAKSQASIPPHKNFFRRLFNRFACGTNTERANRAAEGGFMATAQNQILPLPSAERMGKVTDSMARVQAAVVETNPEIGKDLGRAAAAGTGANLFKAAGAGGNLNPISAVKHVARPMNYYASDLQERALDKMPTPATPVEILFQDGIRLQSENYKNAAIGPLMRRTVDPELQGGLQLMAAGHTGAKSTDMFAPRTAKVPENRYRPGNDLGSPKDVRGKTRNGH